MSAYTTTITAYCPIQEKTFTWSLLYGKDAVKKQLFMIDQEGMVDVKITKVTYS